ncbi:MAG TPA: amino acid ABC transporter permease, partial [Kineosporiaceae bacterium]|nr:amino acid ABC transporter permease [Kineosporiaceae bacterium]
MTSTTGRAGAGAAADRIVAVPVRHPGRWVAAAVVLLVAAALAQSLATNPNLDWPTVGEYLFKDLTLRGIWVTVYLTVAAMVIGVVGGIVVAVMRLS